MRLPGSTLHWPPSDIAGDRNAAGPSRVDLKQVETEFFAIWPTGICFFYWLQVCSDLDERVVSFGGLAMFVAVQDPSKKKINSSLAGCCWREKNKKNSSTGPVSSHQNVQIPCHGEENVIIIPRRESRREKIWFFDLRNSRHAPNRPGDLSHQMVCWGKKSRGLWHTKKI